MWTRWTIKLCVPLASAAVLVGCNQEVNDGRLQNRAAIGNPMRQNLSVSVTGCLGTGPGTNQFVLRHVQPAPLGTQPSDALSAANLTLSDNSSVRLAMVDDDELPKLVGQTVSVTGSLRHDGSNTIGTAGRTVVNPGEPESRTDQSQAAASGQHHSKKVAREAGPIGMQSMNNGTFPEMTVTEIKGTGKRCNTSPVHEER